MKISLIQSYNLRSPDPVLLTASEKGAKVSGGKDVSSLLGSQSDSLRISSQAQWLSSPQGQNPFRADFDNLGKLIESGDLTSALSLLKTIRERMQGNQQANQGGGSGNLDTDFSSLASALQSQDLTTAMKAWETLSQGFKNSDGPGYRQQENG